MFDSKLQHNDSNSKLEIKNSQLKMISLFEQSIHPSNITISSEVQNSDLNIDLNSLFSKKLKNGLIQ